MTDRGAQAREGAVLALAGRRVLITRAPQQASELRERLATLGAKTILIPTIEIAEPTSYRALDDAITKLASYDLLAFTSANAVAAFAERAAALGASPRPGRIAVVGPATARAVEAIGLRVDVMPELFTAESLGKTLAPEAKGQRVLLVLAEAAPAVLEDALWAGGAEVTVAPAYQNRIPQASLAAVKELFAEGATAPDAITFTSASTAHHLVELLDAAGLSLPAGVARVSIGPVTSRALVELGLPAHREALEASLASLVDAVVRALGGAA